MVGPVLLGLVWMLSPAGPPDLVITPERFPICRLLRQMGSPGPRILLAVDGDQSGTTPEVLHNVETTLGSATEDCDEVEEVAVVNASEREAMAPLLASMRADAAVYVEITAGSGPCPDVLVQLLDQEGMLVNAVRAEGALCPAEAAPSPEAAERPVSRRERLDEWWLDKKVKVVGYRGFAPQFREVETPRNAAGVALSDDDLVRGTRDPSVAASRTRLTALRIGWIVHLVASVGAFVGLPLMLGALGCCGGAVVGVGLGIPGPAEMALGMFSGAITALVGGAVVGGVVSVLSVPPMCGAQNLLWFIEEQWRAGFVQDAIAAHNREVGVVVVDDPP